MVYTSEETFKISVDGGDWFVPPKNIKDVEGDKFVVLKAYDYSVAKLCWGKDVKMPSYINPANTQGWKSVLAKREAATTQEDYQEELNDLFEGVPQQKKRKRKAVTSYLPIQIDLNGDSVIILSARSADQFLSVKIDDVGCCVQFIKDQGLTAKDAGGKKGKRNAKKDE
eukprot:TRINITY_DN49303_c0_g1_i1.p1 TRINITY_DN49303_c0_g1~~TRINITY_DN49303_c0_g1_i1.p1  ORF type:complete len:169 (+),score=35.72 TRINITY_DN49303_c0_g1_i1:94-600(+)